MARRRSVDRSNVSGSSKNTPTTTWTNFSFDTGTTFSNSGSGQAFSVSAAPSSGTGGLFSTSTPVGFGQPQNTQITGLLGGTPSTSLFGQPVLNGQTTSPFGTQGLTGASFFGGTSSTSPFGEPPNTQSAGLFGGATFTGSFGQPPNTQNGLCFAEKSSYSGTTIKYSVVQGTDSMVKNGITSNISVKHQCITVMSNYDKKSLEELRKEDYEVQGRVKRPESIVDKCELAFSLIEKCKTNDSALVDEKPNIYSLVEEVSAFIEKCELEPAETDNLACSFEYNLFDLLKTQIGGVKMLKPGQKESSIYSFHAHEMWGEGKTKDAEVQTEDPLESTAQQTQDLMETTDSGLAAQVWDNSLSDVNEKGDHDCSSDKNDNDDENEVGLRGVVEGETSFLVDPNLQISIESQSSGEVISELLDEILGKVDRLAVGDGVGDDSAKQVIDTDD